MSAEISPAVQRAAVAVKETVCTAWPAYVSERMAARIARDGLAAALDVEEMARALYMRPTRNPDFPTWEDQSERIREYWREYARIIRTALLGADS